MDAQAVHPPDPVAKNNNLPTTKIRGNQKMPSVTQEALDIYLQKQSQKEQRGQPRVQGKRKRS